MEVARPYAAAEENRTIREDHYVLAVLIEDEQARRMLTACGFIPPEPVRHAPHGTFTIAPTLTHHLHWTDGLYLGLGETVNRNLCFLLSCLIGPGGLYRWLRGNGADCDALCRALTAELGLDESLRTRIVHWSDEVLHLDAEEGAALMRDLRSQGRRFMMNRKDDGTFVVIPEAARPETGNGPA
ncbi:hypothetical protein [Microbispora sp. ATCC PTA-5024]|uniref:hypothetical protein n=1 Tax=Microbispora sp. ATCC PTA-5024 TaxID=316330 RepID=UPI0003DDE2E4|nr:hypothetical protein [Microbispora sp. ATCC PTA-5024]ETK35989.1 hypothetical protein MPTA5024_10220 [Microbispora sp. ATCC PTA-5024]